MKLANNFVEIKSNKKTITLKNMILNCYLYDFLRNIIPDEIKTIPYSQYFDRCYIKVDNSITFNEKSMIKVTMFDFFLNNPIISETNNSNSSIINYIFKPINGKIYNAQNTETSSWIDEKAYKSRKIMAIGFATSTSNYVGAMLDVSNYDMYYDDGFSVFRQDKIETDAIFYGECETPKHLKFINDNIFACVSGIGVGKSPNKVEKFYNIFTTNYPETPSEEDMSVSFEISNNDGTHKPIYNQKNICFSYPSNNTYMPIYPTRNSYPYIMIFYNYYDADEYGIHLRGQYWEAIKLNKFGNLRATIRYERS